MAGKAKQAHGNDLSWLTACQINGLWIAISPKFTPNEPAERRVLMAGLGLVVCHRSFMRASSSPGMVKPKRKAIFAPAIPGD
jgi:hypothetical protein